MKRMSEEVGFLGGGEVITSDALQDLKQFTLKQAWKELLCCSIEHWPNKAR